MLPLIFTFNQLTEIFFARVNGTFLDGKKWVNTSALLFQISRDVLKVFQRPGLAIALTSDKTEVMANFSLLLKFDQ